MVPTRREPNVQILPCFVTLVLHLVPNTPAAGCFRGSMSVMLVTRQRLQSHSSGIQFVIIVLIIMIVIFHVFVGSVVIVSVKVLRKCELLSHSHRNPMGPSSPLAKTPLCKCHLLLLFSSCHLL